MDDSLMGYLPCGAHVLAAVFAIHNGVTPSKPPVALTRVWATRGSASVRYGKPLIPSTLVVAKRLLFWFQKNTPLFSRDVLTEYRTRYTNVVGTAATTVAAPA
jgi:hypothetical protein